MCVAPSRKVQRNGQRPGGMVLDSVSPWLWTLTHLTPLTFEPLNGTVGASSTTVEPPCLVRLSVCRRHGAVVDDPQGGPWIPHA